MPKINQSGNVFVIILVAVILFAALMFVFSQGLNTGTTKVITSESRAMAIDIIATAQKIERTVGQLVQNGVSEGDISFENDTVSGYDHTPAALDTQRVFNSATGGTINFPSPLPGQTPDTNNNWLFTGGVVVTGHEDDGLSELLVTVPVTLELCQEINKQLKKTVDLNTNLGTITGAKFSGPYEDNALVVVTLSGNPDAACFRGLIDDGGQTGSYTFYKVLLAR